MLRALLFGQGGTGQPAVGYDYGSFHVMSHFTQVKKVQMPVFVIVLLRHILFPSLRTYRPVKYVVSRYYDRYLIYIYDKYVILLCQRIV